MNRLSSGISLKEENNHMTFAKSKKSLGQNFLIQPNIIKKIIFEAKLKDGETVLEVGPGKGALTRALLEAGAQVIAVEKDDELFLELQKTFAKEISAGQLNLIHDDIMNFYQQGIMGGGRTSAFAGGSTSGHSHNIARGETLKENFSVVANIPYYITGEILRKFLSGKIQPKKMTLMVQREVATRICGGFPTPDVKGSPTSGVKKAGAKESLLSLSVKIYGTPRYVMMVGRGNFYPAPNVDSAILNIENISKHFFDNLRINRLWLNPTGSPELRTAVLGDKLWKRSGETPEDSLWAVLHAGFAHKRKFLVSNLGSIAPKDQIMALFKDNNISEKARAENLSLADWRAILTSNFDILPSA